MAETPDKGRADAAAEPALDAVQKPASKPAKEDRLKAALMANLAKRKAQSRGRAANGKAGDIPDNKTRAD